MLLKFQLKNALFLTITNFFWHYFICQKLLTLAKLFEYLDEILQPDQLHLLNVLTNTHNICQICIRTWDCRLTVICDFARYCPRELPKRCTFHLLLDVCTKSRSQLLQDTLLIKPKYADVITYVTNVENKYQHIKIEILSLLEVSDLKVNHSKTELKFPNHLLHNLLQQHLRYYWHITRHAGEPMIGW